MIKIESANLTIKNLVSLTLGAIVWLAIAIITKNPEPSAEIIYWKAGYPISILLSGILGFILPDRPWQWAMNIIWVQFALDLFTNLFITDGDLNLLPPGIVLYFILTIPCILMGRIGAWFSKSLSRKKQQELADR